MVFHHFQHFSSDSNHDWNLFACHVLFSHFTKVSTLLLSLCFFFIIAGAESRCLLIIFLFQPSRAIHNQVCYVARACRFVYLCPSILNVFHSPLYVVVCICNRELFNSRHYLISLIIYHSN